MQRVKPSRIVSAAIFSVTLMLVGTGVASENSFVFIPQADSPGNDYSRVRNSSFEDCTKRCDAQNECNAFTYNQRQGVCFLKRSANRATAFYAFAITGVTRSVLAQPARCTVMIAEITSSSSPEQILTETTTPE